MHDTKYLFKVLVMATLPFLIVSQENPDWDTKVDKDLQEDLKSDKILPVFVSFTPTTETLKDITDYLLEDQNKHLARWELPDIAWGYLNGLRTNDQNTVRNVLRELKYSDKYEVKFFSLWLTNILYIENCNMKAATVILNETKITWIESATKYPDFKLLQHNDLTGDEYGDKITWGLEKIEIQKAWDLVGGAANAGKGAKVGIMDTGFHKDSTLIRDNNHKSYGYFDPAGGSQRKPMDSNGHGTHITGTIVGKNGIGVAPGAEFVSCRACNEKKECPRIYIERCAEHMFCPNAWDNKVEGCSKVVDVVQMSFAVDEILPPWFEAIVDVWAIAKIIPVVGAGNGGGKCTTIGYPATLQSVLTVGSSDENDAASEFTSFGPVEGHGYLKPDFVAPGSSIRSAGLPNKNKYSMSSGSSSAAAHVVGLIAILRGKDGEIGFENVRILLINNTDFLHPREELKCGFNTDDEKPNFKYGYGRINAYKTVAGLK